MKILVWLASVALASLSIECFAQNIAVTKVQVTAGFTKPKVVGDYVLHGESSDPKQMPGAIVAIDYPKSQKLFDLVAEEIPSLELGDLVKVDESSDDTTTATSYLLVGNGVYRLVAYFSDPPAVRRVRIDLQPAKPDPKPPEPDNPLPGPNPLKPVPPDEFGNIGQRVAEWAAGLPKKQQVAELYRKCAVQLETDPLATINSAIESMVASRNKVLTPEEQVLFGNQLIQKINADLQSRWPMQSIVLASYFRAIATGLEGAK